MNLKTILIYESPILFEILRELKDKINLDILTYEKDSVYKLESNVNNN